MFGVPSRPAPRAAHASGRDGFTLIEVLVAVMLVGILATIAFPAYREQMARTRRMDVQSALLEDAGYLQRYYAANNAFDGTPPPRLVVPASPRAGTPSYLIAVNVPPDAPSTYLLTAVRVGAMRGDRCGDFTYDHLGRRGLAPGTFEAGQSQASCWR